MRDGYDLILKLRKVCVKFDTQKIRKTFSGVSISTLLKDVTHLGALCSFRTLTAHGADTSLFFLKKVIIFVLNTF